MQEEDVKFVLRKHYNWAKKMGAKDDLALLDDIFFDLFGKTIFEEKGKEEN